jgi:hypothetical protein
VIPGGGLLEGGRIPPWVENRLKGAMEIGAGAVPILCLSAGTTHKPLPLDARGRPIFESVAGARWLRESGYPDRLLFTEAASWDTVGNAYFARTLHTDPAGWRRLAVITSEFHMPRTEAIFRWVFGASSGETLPRVGYALEFIAVPDCGMAPDALMARREKEAESLARLPDLTAKLPSLPKIHRWLFTEHRAYAAAAKSEGASVDARVLASY